VVKENGLSKWQEPVLGLLWKCKEVDSERQRRRGKREMVGWRQEKGTGLKIYKGIT
jgi:hypothetical protein